MIILINNDNLWSYSLIHCHPLIGYHPLSYSSYSLWYSFINNCHSSIDIHIVIVLFIIHYHTLHCNSLIVMITQSLLFINWCYHPWKSFSWPMIHIITYYYHPLSSQLSQAESIHGHPNLHNPTGDCQGPGAVLPDHLQRLRAAHGGRFQKPTDSGWPVGKMMGWLCSFFFWDMLVKSWWTIMVTSIYRNL